MKVIRNLFVKSSWRERQNAEPDGSRKVRSDHEGAECDWEGPRVTEEGVENVREGVVSDWEGATNNRDGTVSDWEGAESDRRGRRTGRGAESN